MPLLSKSKTTSKKNPTPIAGKGRGKGNGNIMSFFKKAEPGEISSMGRVDHESEESLFLEEKSVKTAEKPIQTPTPPRDEDSLHDVDMLVINSPLSRYNENGIPNKRRRIQYSEVPSSPKGSVKALPQGPFVDDSDTDDESSGASSAKDSTELAYEHRPTTETVAPATSSNNTFLHEDPKTVPVPTLKQESTSIGEKDEFDDLEDFIDEEFPEEGEEFMERRWMEEQAELEIGLEEGEEANGDAPEEMQQQDINGPAGLSARDSESACCPICGGSTGGMAEQASES